MQIAISCGLAFGAALEPPASRRSVTVVVVSAVLVFSAFVNAVHLGYLLIDPDLGAFKSRYNPEELHELAADYGVALRENEILERSPNRIRFWPR